MLLQLLLAAAAAAAAESHSEKSSSETDSEKSTKKVCSHGTSMISQMNLNSYLIMYFFVEA